MATKRCLRCDGKGFIELGIGLASMRCPVCKGAKQIEYTQQLDPTEEFLARGGAVTAIEPELEAIPEIKPAEYGQFLLPSQRDNTGDRKPAGSSKGKAAGNRQRKSQKAKKDVCKGA